MSIKIHELVCDLFANSAMVTVWTGFTPWSWQVSLDKKLSFTLPPAPFVTVPLPPIQTGQIVTRIFALFVLSFPLAFTEHKGHPLVWLSGILITLLRHSLSSKCSYTPRAEVSSFPIQNISNARLLSHALILFRMFLFDRILTRLLNPNLVCLRAVVPSTASMLFNWSLIVYCCLLWPYSFTILHCVLCSGGIRSAWPSSHSVTGWSSSVVILGLIKAHEFGLALFQRSNVTEFYG